MRTAGFKRDADSFVIQQYVLHIRPSFDLWIIEIREGEWVALYDTDYEILNACTMQYVRKKKRGGASQCTKTTYRRPSDNTEETIVIKK